MTLGNPKVMVFYIALLPTIINLTRVGMAGWASLALTILVVLVAVNLARVFFASRAKRLPRGPRAVRAANRGRATITVGAAAAIAGRS